MITVGGRPSGWRDPGGWTVMPPSSTLGPDPQADVVVNCTLQRYRRSGGWVGIQMAIKTQEVAGFN
jgi:hypothetical protein